MLLAVLTELAVANVKPAPPAPAAREPGA
jgi:hypothetical protein